MTGTAAMHAGNFEQLEEYILPTTLERIASARPDLAQLVADAALISL